MIKVTRHREHKHVHEVEWRTGEPPWDPGVAAETRIIRRQVRWKATDTITGRALYGATMAEAAEKHDEAPSAFAQAVRDTIFREVRDSINRNIDSLFVDTARGEALDRLMMITTPRYGMSMNPERHRLLAITDA